MTGKREGYLHRTRKGYEPPFTNPGHNSATVKLWCHGGDAFYNWRHGRQIRSSRWLDPRWCVVRRERAPRPVFVVTGIVIGYTSQKSGVTSCFMSDGERSVINSPSVPRLEVQNMAQVNEAASG